MLLKGIIGAGSADTVLASILRAFVAETFGPTYVKPQIESFPSAGIAQNLKSQSKDPQITEEVIDSLLFTQKDAGQAYTILAQLAS